MKNLHVALLAGALSACASQPNTTEAPHALQQDIDQLSEQQQQLLKQTESITEALAQQDQRFELLQQELATPQTTHISTDKAEPSTCKAGTKQYKLGNKLVLGEAEWVLLTGVDSPLDARIDTGASTSSLNANDVVKFERDGKTWVRFDINHGDQQQKLSLERPVVRYAEIKQSSSNKTDRRPVVSILVKIGDMSEQTEFTLADRNHLSYPVLLGRNFLRDIAIVDISKQHSQGKPAGKE